MTNENLNPEVLGQLLLMQSIVNNLPDNDSIISFVCKGLIDIPGISDISYCEKTIAKKDVTNSQLCFPIAVNNSFFGTLKVVLTDKIRFEPYKPYVSNFIFMIAVVLEERKQRKINNQHKSLLKLRIKESTRELNLEKKNLIESQRRFTDLMVNINLLSVMLNTNGNIIFCNKFLTDITGYSEGEILGNNWFDIFIPKDQVNQIKKVFRAVMNGQEYASHYENEIIAKNGEKLIISWNNTILQNAQSNIIGVATIGENATQRKQDELLLKKSNEEYQQVIKELNYLNKELIKSQKKAEESDRLKTAFLQNMSHEIRTPMNAIMGFSDLLSDNFNDKEKLEKFTKIISDRSMDLLTIIDDLLDISKIESNQLPVNIEECNLTKLFEEINSFYLGYQTRIHKTHVKFSIRNYCDDSKILIFTDIAKLKQIFINLIGNACKFTEKGFIEAGCKYGKDNKLEFFVTDTGIGIEENNLEKIFERFYQVNQGGTGLGLAIVKGLVDLLGGEISLESKAGKGSTFTFTIPHESKQVVSTKPKKIAVSSNFQFNGKTILIVEDDSFNSEYLKEVISATGAKIMQTMYGEEALQLAVLHPIDLILMDVQLPGINGYETTKKIKTKKPEIKIIAQTAYAINGENQKAMEAGCNGYISKPTNKKQLLSLLNKHLNS